jgi:hypothetical protein
MFFVSCKKAEHKTNDFVFRLAQDDNSEMFGTFKKAERPFCSYLKVFLGKDEQGEQRSFNANILKDGSKFYLMYPLFNYWDFDTIMDDDYIWYKILFFDRNLMQSETVLSKKRARINENDSMYYYEQNMILKMERKISILNNSYYLFSQSFGYYGCFYPLDPNIKTEYVISDKPETFAKLYFAYSTTYGFVHLPFLENSTLIKDYCIPYFEDNSWLYNLNVD